MDCVSYLKKKNTSLACKRYAKEKNGRLGWDGIMGIIIWGEEKRGGDSEMKKDKRRKQK